MTITRKEINDLGDEIINLQKKYRRTLQGNGAQRRKLTKTHVSSGSHKALSSVGG